MKKLLDYIQGNKRGKDAHDLEREAMQDAFLQDALDGYESVEGKHVESISRLQEQVSLKTRKKKQPVYWYVAAVVLLLVSVGGIFFMVQNQEEEIINEIAYHTEIEKTIPSASMEESESVYPEPVQSEGENRKEPEPLAVHKQKSETDQSLTYNYDSREYRRDLPPVKEEDKLSLSYEIAKIPEIPSPAVSGQWYVGAASDSVSDRKETTDEVDRDLLAVSSGINRSEIMNRAEEILESPKDDYLQESSRKRQRDSKKEKVAAGRISSEMRYEAAGDSKAAASTVSVPVIGVSRYNQYLKEQISLLSLNDECSKSKGTAVLRFTVDSQGRPQDIKVKKSLCSTIDNRLIELIKKGSDWTQGEGQIEFSR